jgi:hypothetical protein
MSRGPGTGQKRRKSKTKEDWILNNKNIKNSLSFSRLALELKVVHKVLMSSNLGHVVFVQ